MMQLLSSLFYARRTQLDSRNRPQQQAHKEEGQSATMANASLPAD
jgi:hypothetical protein